MKPPDADRRPPVRAAESITYQTTTSSSHQDLTARWAEDAAVLLAEFGRWIDGLDIVVLAAQDGRVSPADALEQVLVGHGRMRRLLGAAVVGVI